MISVSVKLDTQQVDAMLKKLAGPAGTKTAIARALNRTGTRVRDRAAREIREKRNLPLNQIKSAIQLRRASARNLQCIVIARGRPISIRHFARAGKRGVTAKVSKTSARVLLRKHGNRAFTNKGIGAGTTVFVRTSKRRLPLEAWPKVSGIASVFRQRRIEQLMREEVRSTFKDRLRTELRFVIEQARR